MKVIVVSPPRSGSSVVSQLLESAGYIYPDILDCHDSINISPSQFNSSGYNEDVAFTLLNDQLIRLIYGPNYSFLHSPPCSLISSAYYSIPDFDYVETFHYDIDELSLVTPENYLSRLDELSSHTWDVWGLSRMLKNGKWYKAYSKCNLAGIDNIRDGLRSVRSFFLNNSGASDIYIKDPRMIFSLPAYVQEVMNSSFGVILIDRNSQSLLKSMRAHYGHRLFTDNCIDDFQFVSNHFNHQVMPQSFDDYLSAISAAKLALKTLGVPLLELSYDKIMNKDFRDSEVKKLEKFISKPVDQTILYNPSFT